MVMTFSSIKGIYTKRECTIEDIDEDVEKVLSVLDNKLDNKQEYIDNMLTSIYQQRAYCVYRDGVKVGFLYTRVDSAFPNRLIASSLWSTDIVAFVILMLSLTLSRFQYLIVVPHEKNFQYFKSLITKSSLRQYHAGLLNYVIIKKDKTTTSHFLKIIRLFQVRKVV